VLFVDDNSILAVGKDFATTHNMIKDMINRPQGINEWARDHNCTFGIKKYQLCDLSWRRVPEPFRPRKRMPENRPDMMLNGHRIKSQPVVKLLGIHIDRELRWKEQAAAALGKGQDWLVQFGRLAKVTKGTSAKNIRQLYTSIALPRILYGADFFLSPTQRRPGATLKKDNRAIITKLKSVQRRAAIMITGATATTPGDLLDAHADLIPMALLIDKHLHRSAVRFSTLPASHPLYKAIKNAATRQVKRHPTPLHYIMNNYRGVKPHLIETIEPVRTAQRWTHRIKIHIAKSKEEARKEDEEEEARWKVYTDGSGMEGMIGAGAVLYKDGRVKDTRRLRLGSDKHHTVYEGEGIGMVLGLQLLKEEREEISGRIPMGVDNQAAIITTGNNYPGPAHYIWDQFHKELGNVLRNQLNLDIVIRWTPGHEDIAGNERADEEAKKAAQEGSSPLNKLPRYLKKTLPKSKSALRQAHHAKIKARAKAHWQASPRYQRIKDIDATLPSPSFRKLTENLTRKQAAMLIQLRSGHAPLAKHLHRIGKTASPVCPYCRAYEETVIHYLILCPGHTIARREMNRRGGRETREYTKLLSNPDLMEHLFRFITKTSRFRTTYGDLSADEDATETTDTP
jgi:ribonuclease HI